MAVSEKVGLKLYRNLPAARYKFDINPSAPEIIPGDAKYIPLKDECISSEMVEVRVREQH